MSGSAIRTRVERITRYIVLVHLSREYKATQMGDALLQRMSELRKSLRGPTAES